MINNSNYDIGIAPLVDDVFNGCKSDIKFLDYSALGIPTICSRGSAYRAIAEAGLVLSCDNTPEQWLQAFTLAMENRELMLSLVNRSWDYLWGQRSTATSALQLLAHLDNPSQLVQTAGSDLPITKPSLTNRIAVCIHLYYVHRWALIRPCLDNISDGFDLFVTCPEDQISAVRTLVLTDFPRATLVPIKNQGMDVLPFLRLNHDHALWRYDAVLKLHTKNDKTQDGDTIGRLCLDALLGSLPLVDSILQEISRHDIGMVGPEILYRSASKLMYGNESQVRQILGKLDLQYPRDDWGFFAGTMFWVHGAVLQKLAAHFDELSILAVKDVSLTTTGGDGTWAHAMERIFGMLLLPNHLRVAVSYPSSLTGQRHRLRRVSGGDLSKNAAFRNGSTAHLIRYKNLHAWAEVCKINGFFDDHYYIVKAGGIVPPDMDPIVHFLLYGDDLVLDPSPAFSTEYYKKHNGDVLKARIPTLVHYLTRGKKEGRRFSAANSHE
jgi:hypothetical protein